MINVVGVFLILFVSLGMAPADSDCGLLLANANAGSCSLSAGGSELLLPPLTLVLML